MEAACYTLDLYCDDPLHLERHPGKFESLDAQYIGQTYGECKRQAKADGWKWVSYKNICKRCTEENKRK